MPAQSSRSFFNRNRAVPIFVPLSTGKEVCILKEHKTEVRRGDIFYADLSPVVGSEQGGVRPVLILQNDVGNRHSPTVIVCAITGQTDKACLPTHVPIGRHGRLAKLSTALLEQIRTIDRSRLRERIGRLRPETMKEIDRALGISVGLVPALFYFPKTEGR